jgi:plasmid stabilization system protein ParE
MLPVVWLDNAITDLTEIITYIAAENLCAARRLKTRLETAPLPLAEHPYLYPVWGASPAHVNLSHILTTS